MTDEITLNEPILGVLQTSENTFVPAMIHDTGRHYELTVNYDYDRAAIHDQWIANALESSDWPLAMHYPPNANIDRENTLPKVLHVIADGKPLSMIDCTVFPGSIHPSYPQGDAVRIMPRVIVHIRPDEPVERISKLRSVIPGMLAWSGSYSLTHTLTDTGQGTEVSVPLRASPPIELDEARGLSLIPNAIARERPSSVVALDFSQDVVFESATEAPEEWDHHFTLHRRMKALVALARYEPLTFTGMSLPRLHEHDQQHQVLCHDPKIDPSFSTNNNRQQLFTLTDIGPEGVRKWFDLYDQCPQGINGLNYLIENSVHIALEPHYLMMCTAFEKIGYFIHNNGSDHEEEQSFVEYITAIIDDVNSDKANIPLSYPETWKTDTNKLYKDIKHAGRNHTQPEGEQLLKHLNEGILLMRVWIAKRLGCDMAKITTSLRYDHQVNMYGIKLHQQSESHDTCIETHQ